MVRSIASAVLGAGQSKLSHPHTDAKFPNRCQRRAGGTPRSTSRVCASPAGLLSEGLERRGALIEGFTRSRPKEVPARVGPSAEGRHQEQDEEDRVEEGNNRESTATTLRRPRSLANDRAQRPGLKECCPPGGSGTSLLLARRSSPIRLTPKPVAARVYPAVGFPTGQISRFSALPFPLRFVFVGNKRNYAKEELAEHNLRANGCPDVIDNS